MKNEIKLYNCSAKIVREPLSMISYNTRTVEFINGECYLYLTRTNTTYSHVRKFIQWLKDNGYSKEAYNLKTAYTNAIQHKWSHVSATAYLVTCHIDAEWGRYNSVTPFSEVINANT